MELVPYDESWPKRFRDMAERLQTVMGGSAERVEHVGSTSVPGLAAKPIIDIQVSALSPEGVFAHAPELRDLGFEYLADNDDYADAKGDCIWQLLREADRWSWNQRFE